MKGTNSVMLNSLTDTVNALRQDFALFLLQYIHIFAFTHVYE